MLLLGGGKFMIELKEYIIIVRFCLEIKRIFRVLIIKLKMFSRKFRGLKLNSLINGRIKSPRLSTLTVG